ncbi:cellulose biosynthesis protein BcsP [Pigmentiphaga sp. GD03639]|nr:MULTISPECIES: cellulose biosynthesis protein BcsP [unclassified Pigmentiphaga]MDH2235845.1 cellulose biosynthesis protein BcsP [Pigmentiphaga sp. GD03639]OVZ60857.1 hypothetical protein CDO46_20915 [Pigmentiphaga sp. NML030171]
MKESDDIANLFRHFGGQPGQYQEISRANEARQSRERWPLLASIEADQAAQFPPVEAPVPSVPQAPQPAAAPPAADSALQPAAPPAGRIEPRLSPATASPPPPQEAPNPPRAAEFIPPRAGALSDRMRPAAALAAQQPAQVGEPAPRPAPAPRTAADTYAGPEQEPAPQLQALFTRLARPASRPTADKSSASLLERLNRL